MISNKIASLEARIARLENRVMSKKAAYNFLGEDIHTETKNVVYAMEEILSVDGVGTEVIFKTLAVRLLVLKVDLKTLDLFLSLLHLKRDLIWSIFYIRS